MIELQQEQYLLTPVDLVPASRATITARHGERQDGGVGTRELQRTTRARAAERAGGGEGRGVGSVPRHGHYARAGDAADEGRSGNHGGAGRQAARGSFPFLFIVVYLRLQLWVVLLREPNQKLLSY